MAALDRPELARLWDVLAERLQRNGLRPSGALRLDGLQRAERHALAGLLGRPVAHDRVTIDLAELDRRLRRNGAGAGLVAAVEARRGPLVDRPGQRQARTEARGRVWAAGRSELHDAGLEAASWVETWFDDLRQAGILGRVPPEQAEQALRTGVRCAAALPAVTGDPACGRGDLASIVTLNAHGLDDGTLLAAVVLRAAAAIARVPYPRTPAARRALWRAVGVTTDEVSTTALTAGLRSAEGGWLDERTQAGWESHLTARDLHRLAVRPPADGVVFVCENPRVLEAAIDAGCRRALVCTQGQPAVVVTTLIEQLAAQGADLRYHGDFDWPGLTIANLLIGRYGCHDWRFAAADYLAALGRLAPMVGELPLLGPDRVNAGWDPALTAEMAVAGRAVHEELLLDELLADLAGLPRGQSF